MIEAEHLTHDELIDGLRTWAMGSWCAEAAVGLLIDHERWLRRSDFRRQAVWVDRGEEDLDDGLIVGIDWEAAAGLANGVPASASEIRVLELAVALVAGNDHPVDLGDALTSLDASNTTRVLRALEHAAGAHQRRAEPLCG